MSTYVTFWRDTSRSRPPRSPPGPSCASGGTTRRPHGHQGGYSVCHIIDPIYFGIGSFHHRRYARLYSLEVLAETEGIPWAGRVSSAAVCSW